MPKIKHIQSTVVYEVSDTPRWVAGVWECGDQRFTDETGEQYLALVEPPVYPKVSAPQFKLLLTPFERLAVTQRLPNDPMLKDFYQLLDDPRLTEVDLALPSNQAAVDYVLSVVGPVMNPPYSPEKTAERRAVILSGVLS